MKIFPEKITSFASLFLFFLLINDISPITSSAQKNAPKTIYSPMTVYEVKNCPTGEILLTGYIEYSNGYLVRFDKKGNVVWRSKIEDSYAHIGLQSSSQNMKGDIFTAGDYRHGSPTFEAAIIMKISPADDTIRWARKLSFGNVHTISSVVATNDGGCVVTGFTSANTTFIVKYDSGGTALWVRKMGPEGSVLASRILEEASGNLVVSVFIIPSGVCIMRLDRNGNVVQTASYKTPADLGISSFIKVLDNRFLLAYATSTSSGKIVGYLTLDSTFKIMANTGGGLFSNFILNTMVQKPDGNIMALEFDPAKQAPILTEWSPQQLLLSVSDFQLGIPCRAAGIAILDSGGIFIAGDNTNNPLYADPAFYILRIDQLGSGCATIGNFGISDTGAFTTSTFQPVFIDTLADSAVTIPSLKPSAIVERYICESSATSNETQPSLLMVENNPSSSHRPIVIKTSGLAQGNYVVTMYSIEGINISCWQVPIGSEEEIRLPQQEIPAGVYLIEIRNANTFNRLWSTKIVLE